MSRQQRENPESKPLIAGAVKVLFEVIKHFLHDFEVNRTAKKFERYADSVISGYQVYAPLSSNLERGLISF
jgi:hypothetical protein